MYLLQNPFIISLLSGGGIALILWLTQGFWLDSEMIFAQQSIKWILISVFWLILGVIWKSKDKNTQILKKILLIVEIYLFLLIFIQSGSNFSQGEFMIFYLSGVWITYEALYPRTEKRKRIFLMSCYGSINLFLLSIALFMQWRSPFDEQEFFNQQKYSLYLISNDTPYKNYYTINLKSSSASESLQLLSWMQQKTLDKNSDFSLLFSSLNYNPDQKILIQDPSWNLLEIFPQSEISFSTHTPLLIYEKQWGKIEWYAQEKNFPPKFGKFQQNYQESKKTFALTQLPPRFRSNPKLQQISWIYTNRLWKIFPFRYGYSLENFQTFLPYLSFSWVSKNYNKTNTLEVLRSTSKIWEEKTNGWKQYREYFKKLF